MFSNFTLFRKCQWCQPQNVILIPGLLIPRLEITMQFLDREAGEVWVVLGMEDIAVGWYKNKVFSVHSD